MKLKYGVIIISILALSACAMHKVTDKKELCNQAKRQQIFNENSPSLDSHYVTNGQKQKLDDSVSQNCEA